MKFKLTLFDCAVLFSICFSIGCATSVKPPASRETNWLKTCRTDKQCGEAMDCRCGICSTGCDEMDECAELNERSVCADVSHLSIAAACEQGSNVGSIGLCVLPCITDSDCVGSSDTDLKCHSNYCIDEGYEAEPEEPSSDGGTLSDSSQRDVETIGEPCETDIDCLGTQVCNARGECVVVDSGVNDDVGVDTGVDRLRTACSEDGLCEGELLCHLDNTCIERGVFDENGFATLAFVPDQIEYIAVDDTHIYWTQLGTEDLLGNYQNDGAIMSMPIDGGPITVIAESQQRPRYIIVDDSRLYWVNFYEEGGGRGIDEVILSVPKDGSDSPEVIADNIDIYSNAKLAQSDDNLYYLDYDLGPCRVEKNGSGEVEQLAEELKPFGDPYYIMSLVVDSDAVYLGHSSGVVKLPLDSLEYFDLVNDHPDQIDGEEVLLVDNGLVYYTINEETEVVKVPTTGGDSTTVLLTGDWPVRTGQIQIYNDYFFYYTSDIGRYEIGRAPLEPGESEVLVSIDGDEHEAGPYLDLEVTDQGLFWSQFGSTRPAGRITRFDHNRMLPP